MTALRTLGVGLALLVATGIALLVGGLVWTPEAVARGWLVAFGTWSCVPIGSLTLLLIHRLTGGAWGRAAAPILRPAAALTPLAAIAFLPVLLSLPGIYPWAADPAAAPPDVARWYLNATSFTARAIVALGGWTVLGIMFAAGSGSRLVAGLGLAFLGLTISLVAVDWFLSVEPRYTASAFAATIAVQQLGAALATTAVIGAPDLDGKVAGDIGGLLIATLLGVVYLELMTFVIAWYGDLPDKAAWFLKRGDPGWLAALLTALLAGAVLPFGILLVGAARRSRLGLRVAGGLILFGTALHFAWLILPASESGTGAIVAAVGGLGLLGLISLLAGSLLRPRPELRGAG